MNAIAKIDVSGCLARTFFKPVDTSIIDVLLDQYKEKEKAIRFADHFLNWQATQGTLTHYFLAEYKEDVRHYRDPRFSNLETAQSYLDAEFWDKALRQTDVYEHMPEGRRYEWYESIKKREVPKFERNTLIDTLKGLLLNRDKFLAERVDGIFQSLSREHVTNQPQGFNKRMIIYAVDAYGHTSNTKLGHINDLRLVIAKFMARDEPRYSSTYDMIDAMRGRYGKWHEIDGGTLRMRLFKKGTCHLEVHPDIAWRLNEILSWLYPAAIPAELRRKPKKEKTYKPVDLTQNLLPFAVLEILAKFRNYGNRVYSFDKYRVADKHLRERFRTVIEALGGVENGGVDFTFDYRPEEVINKIVLSGQMPDQKAHQFYPTPSSLALELVALADIQEGDKILEPSAGQGGLAMHLPKVNLTCVEVSPLHCEILTKKGMSDVQNADFIQWAEKAPDLYDRIVMNPPFSHGRAEQHLEAASKLLKVGGVLVAILPVGMKSKPEMEGFKYEWSEERKGEFPGVSISVVMLKLTRELYA